MTRDMPLPAWLGRFNRRVTNHVSEPLAGRLPGFAVVIHTGRRSGRRYRTPVNLFRSDDGFVIALTYGRHGDWVRNVLASDGCDVQTRGAILHLVDPRIVTDTAATMVPAAVRPILWVAHVTDLMCLRRATATEDGGASTPAGP